MTAAALLIGALVLALLARFVMVGDVTAFAASAYGLLLMILAADRALDAS